MEFKEIFNGLHVYNASDDLKNKILQRMFTTTHLCPLQDLIEINLLPVKLKILN